MVILYLKKTDLFLPILIGVIIVCGIVGIVTFVLYARARMKEQEEKERVYLRIHYTALTLVFLLGMVFLFYMVNTSD
jgi:cytochrome c oxidase assembly factor CtaG